MADAKLRVPRLGAEIIRRGRLTELIEECVAHPVTAISAAPGAGKTVACAAWAADRGNARRVAWLSLDERDADPARFWPHLTAALAAGGRPRGRGLPPRGRGPADDPPVTLMDTMRDLPGPVVLVLDDVQVLADSGVLPGLSFLIHRAPPALHLVLCGRWLPGLHLARMRVAGDLAEVTGADLACTADEADAYFARLGIAAGAAERDELLHRLEGWMAGLRMTALCAGQDGRISVSGIGGAPIVADYLRDEVLDRLPDEIRLFLRRTSVAERLTGQFADWLTGEPAGARVLERLGRENGFVSCDADGRYRYHAFLREVLLAELRRQAPQDVPVLLERAARWHVAQGDVIEAVRCSAQAADWAQASLALVEAGISGVLPDRAAELEEALALFPPGQRAADAAVAAAVAAARLCGRDPESGAAYLSRAKRALGGCPPAARPVVELWLAALETMQAAGRPDPRVLSAGWSLAERAHAQAGTPSAHRALGMLWLVLGTSLRRGWQLGDARRALGYAGHQLTAGGLDATAERAGGWQALAEALYGDLRAAEAVIARPRRGGHHDPAGRCFAALAAAALAIERDDLLSAAQLLDEADTAAVRWLPGEPDAAALRTLLRARAALAGGDPVAARGLVMLVRERLDAGLPALDVLEAEIALHAGDRALAAALLGPADGQPPRSDRLAASARLLLADGDHAGALTVAGRCLDGPDAAAARLRDRITALLTAAVASRRLGARGDAAAFLEQALAVAELHDAYRPFLDMGGPVHSAIAIMVPPASPAAAFAARVRERFVCQLPAKAIGAPAAAGGSPLTTSELAVLRLLDSHLTNQEIADTLFVSVNTVKTHLRSAYHKLGVASRRDAIARGRRLRLL